MHKTPAISIRNVTKSYHLFSSPKDQFLSVFGLTKIGFRLDSPPKEFVALDNISLEVPKGRRIGIIGRNGAGKTTLLKLICGNYAPTKGALHVEGNVQALMSVGLGFHPEFTGRENLLASLNYNDLNPAMYDKAVEEVIDFCELGDHLDQPFKTYSLGMQARLMFAAATAITPDILIVDEVLGAGDAYFVAKSKKRIEKLIESGCTMLLVSHSMSQVLELCDEVVWLDQGKIRMHDESFVVVKAYEEYMHGSINNSIKANVESVRIENSVDFPLENHHDDESEASPPKIVCDTKDIPASDGSIQMQEPYFMPHKVAHKFPIPNNAFEFNYITKGGISRWGADISGTLSITGFTIIGEHQETNKLESLKPAKFVFAITAIKGGEYNCRYGLNISNPLGQTVTSIKSPPHSFHAKSGGESRVVEVVFNPLQLGPGDFTVGISLITYTPLTSIGSSKRYDLLSRSFEFSVTVPSTLGAFDGQFFHSTEWLYK